MKAIIAVVLLAMLAACDQTAKAPVQSTRTQNGYQVEKLATHDGCTVYSIYDSRPIYWARCKDTSEPVTTSYTESCGKGCTRNVVVTTTQEEGK